MPWNAASRFFANGAHRVHAAVWTDRQFSIRSVAKVGPQIVHRWRVGRLFFIFQRPLLFGRVNKAEIVDAGIHVLRFLSLGLERCPLAPPGLRLGRPCLRLGRHALIECLNLLPRPGQFVGLLPQLLRFGAQTRQFAHLRLPGPRRRRRHRPRPAPRGPVAPAMARAAPLVASTLHSPGAMT